MTTATAGDVPPRSTLRVVPNPPTARRALEDRHRSVVRVDAKLHASITWTGIAMSGLGASWIAGWSLALRAYPPSVGAVLGVVLLCASVGVAYGSARRQLRLMRGAALVTAGILAAAAILVVDATGDGAGAVTYIAMAGLHVVWALRSG